MSFDPPNTYNIKNIIQKWNSHWIILIVPNYDAQVSLRYDLKRDGFDAAGPKWKETILDNTAMYIVNAETEEEAEEKVIGKYTAPRAVLELFADSMIITKKIKENSYKDKVHKLTRKEKKKYFQLLKEEII